MTKELAPLKKIENFLVGSEILSLSLKNNSNKYIKSVLMEISKTQGDPKKDLTVCSPISILMAVKHAIDLGLEIDARQHCHLVKYGAGCQLQIGYKGYLYKIKQHYPDAHIICELVKKGDVFNIIKEGDNDSFIHKISNPFAGQDTIIGGYCFISYSLGARKISQICTMSSEEILKIRSKAKTDFIWKEWFEEKAKVAIIRRACKVLFGSLPEIAKLNEFNNEEFDLSKKDRSEELELVEDLPPINLAEDTI